MSGVTQKIFFNNLYTDFNSLWRQCCMMFACHFDKNVFVLLLFEEICQSNIQNKSIATTS
jgi:hypothetical protein